MKARLREWTMGRMDVEVTYMDGRELSGKIKNFDDMGLELEVTKVNSHECSSTITLLVPWCNIYEICQSGK